MPITGDLVILFPSISELSESMQVCELYGLNHNIKYNSKKGAILICKSKHKKNVEVSWFNIIEETIQDLYHFIFNKLHDDKDILWLLYAFGVIRYWDIYTKVY